MLAYVVRRIGYGFLVVLGVLGFLFVLFFFTDASAWAENYTSTNRLILHIVPALFSLLALLLASLDPAPRETVRGSPGRTSPA